jgi:hypothetical protein
MHRTRQHIKRVNDSYCYIFIFFAGRVLVVGTCFVRKAIEKIFSMDELKWLDDLMPEDSRKKKEEDKMKDDEEHN